MNVSSSKENILKKIRQALSASTPIPFPQSEGYQSVFSPSTQDPGIEFAEQFTKLSGKFIFCENHQELATHLNELVSHRNWTKIFCREEKLITILKEHRFNQFGASDLGSCEAAITSCELLVARTGSIILSAAGPSGRTVSVYAPVHICIAYTDQLVYDIKEGLQLIKEKYQHHLPSMITLATGPSRTADIEKTLVIGVHGPKEVYLFLVDRNS